MGYINYKIMNSKFISIDELGVLQLIKQNKIEDLSQEIEFSVKDTNILEKWSDIGYIEFIKLKKGLTKYHCVRTTKKANIILEDISTPDITEDSIKIFEWVKNVYIGLDKEIGNQKKCKQYISNFSAESGIVRNSLAFLIQEFINDEKEMEYSQRMEYLFYKGASVFNVKFDLHQSRLYQYYQKRENYFNNVFKRWE